jgi:hypothetical protein
VRVETGRNPEELGWDELLKIYGEAVYVMKVRAEKTAYELTKVLSKIFQ